MGTLEEFVNGLPTNKQKEVALYFCRVALPIWEAWAKKHKKQLTYRDSVVYMFHKTPPTLLKEAIEISEKAQEEALLVMNERFLEPIVALQDMDWELPYIIERCFYAVYNLVEAVRGKQNYYICLNQAIDAIVSSEISTMAEVVEKLESFIAT